MPQVSWAYGAGPIFIYTERHCVGDAVNIKITLDILWSLFSSSSLEFFKQNNIIYYSTNVMRYLVSKRLWWVVDDDRFRQVSAQDGQIFDVVSVDTHTMFTKQPMSGDDPVRISQNWVYDAFLHTHACAQTHTHTGWGGGRKEGREGERERGWGWCGQNITKLTLHLHIMTHTWGGEGVEREGEKERGWGWSDRRRTGIKLNLQEEGGESK